MRRLALGVLGAALLSAAVVAAPADWRQAYLDGRRAFERGRWSEAVELLSAAAAERPEEQARARLVGVIPEPYLPHHLLGRAHLARGDCAAALAAWAESTRQGVVATLPRETAEAAAGRRLCEPTSPGAPAVAPPPARADDAPRAADIAAAPPPSEAAGPAGTLPSPTEPDAASRGDAGTVAPRGIAPRGADASTVAATPPGEVRAADAEGSLLAAAASYLDGDYRRVLELLAADPPPLARRARLRGRVLRAAAWNALYRLGGEVEPELLAAARREVAAVRREAPGFRPSPDAFPPSLVALFDAPPAGG